MNLRLLLAVLMCRSMGTSKGDTVVKITSLKNNKIAKAVAIKEIVFCKHCADPKEQGSRIQGVLINRPPYEWNWEGFAAPLVYAFPNQGCRRGLKNPVNDVRGAVIMFNRGDILSVTEQVRLAHRMGSVAVIIIDTPREKKCSEYPKLPCRDVFVSLTRGYHGWEEAKFVLPTLLVSHEEGLRLASSLDLIRRFITGYGWQNFETNVAHDKWVPHYDIEDL